MTIESFLLAILPSLCVSVIMVYFNKANKKKEEELKLAEESRREGEKVQLELIFSAVKLSFAVAMAIKRGSPNGEIEEGIVHYKKAMDSFKQYERKLVVKERI